MLNLYNLLETTYPAWVTTLVPVIRYVFLAIMFLCAVVLVVVALFQNNSNDDGAFLSGGATESYYAQNKSGTMAGKLKVITIVCATVIAVLAVLYFVSNLIYAGV